MARPLWSGTISFGLVNIPVKLLSAVSPKEVHFHMLHDADGARIRQKRVCAADGKEVPYENVVKGYEISPGRYVTVSKEELEALDAKASRAIDIQEFVELQEIDPIYYERTYYLVPDKGAAKAYGLLLEAMKKTQRAAVARMVMRSKQYLCAMRPMDKGLVLSTLLYGDEVVPQSEFEELEPAEFKPQPRELEMAQQLVESLAGHFDVTQYKDEHRERLLAMIEAKAEGQQVVEAPEAEEERPKVVNLMDALKRSLEASSKDAAKGERRHRPEAARTAAPKKAPSRKRKSA